MPLSVTTRMQKRHGIPASRQHKSEPILHQLKTRLYKTLPYITPQSALGRAVNLAGNWPRFIPHIEGSHRSVDNNPTDRAIFMFVIGRESCLLSGTSKDRYQRADLQPDRNYE